MGRTVTATTAVLLLVAGCAGPSGSTPTAVAPAAAESCAQVSTDLSAIRADVEAAAGKVPDDIPGAATQLADAVTRVQNLAGQVSDPTVADLVQNVATNLASLQITVQNAADDPIGTAPTLIRQVRETKSSIDALTDYCSNAT